MNLHGGKPELDPPHRIKRLRADERARTRPIVSLDREGSSRIVPTESVQCEFCLRAFTGTPANRDGTLAALAVHYMLDHPRVLESDTHRNIPDEWWVK